MSFYHFLLITLILTCTHSQTCQNVQDISSLLQTGKIQVFNAFNPPSTLKNRFRTFDIPIQYQIPSSGFQIAASISNSIFTSFFNNSLDFTVRGGRSSTINIAQIALFITEDPSWTILDISYLASSRNDLFIGSFIADGYIFQSGNSNLLTVNYGLPNFAVQNGQVTVIAQLAGLRTIVKSNLLFSISNTTANNKNGLITIIIQTNLPFQMLFLNYYWWNNNPSITFAELNIGSGTFVAYSLAGINKINGTELAFTNKGFNLIGFLQCNGINCPKSCISQNQCQSSNGISISSSCFLCGTGQIYREGNCDNTNSCKAKQYFDGSLCDCIDGYQKVNGICMPTCGNNAYVDANVDCQCLPKEIIKGKNGKNPNPRQNNRNKNNNKNNKQDCQKVKICSRSNQVLINGNCTCEDGFALVNGNCASVFSCKGGSIWNSATYSCVCPEKQFFINGNCSMCPNNSYWNGVICICNSGFIFTNGVCRNCPLNSTWNGFSCICDQGFNFINGICSKCPQNSLWDGTSCKCQSGFFLINGSCGRCPQMSIWVQSQNSCICISGYFLMNGICVTCPINSGWNGNSCVCLSGYYLINGICINCPKNSGWNGTACVCLSGYYLQQKSCVSCQPNSSWNGTACVCLNGWYLSNSGCIQCEAGFLWNGTACVCPEGSYFSINKCIKCQQNEMILGNKCVCIFNYFQINGRCQKLPENAYYNGTSFICSANFYWIDNSCKNCGINQVWNGKICQCRSNFYLINGTCTSCTSGMIWNGTACACPTNTFMMSGSCQQCRPNSAWNGTLCQCLTNYYLSNNVCITCPNGNKWNGISCVSICPSNSSWNGSSCICDQNFIMINNLCLQCDSNSIYNIELLTCTCKQGFYGDFNKCSACSESCSTCNGSGSNMCLTCLQDRILTNGSCLIPNNGCGYGKIKINNICQTCPQNCLTCKDINTCTICQSNFVLAQKIEDKNSILGCIVPPPPSALSLLSLKGAVVVNGALYQGVTLSTLPTYFLANNCNDCNDLFTIDITPGSIGISYSVQYVLYSQYWFIIVFNYAGILPQFQYKVQINKKYSQYFTPSDLSQIATASANSIKYPEGNPQTKQANNIIKSSLSRQGSQLKPSTLIRNNQNNKNNLPQITRQVVVSDGTPKTYPANTIVSLFS